MQSLLRVVWQRLVVSSADPDHAPDLAVDDDRDAGRNDEARVAVASGDGPRQAGVVLDSRWTHAVADCARHAGTVERPAAACFEAGLVDRGEHGDHALGLDARQHDRWHAEHSHDLLGQAGEQLAGAGANGDERCNPPERSLFVDELAKVVPCVAVRDGGGDESVKSARRASVCSGRASGRGERTAIAPQRRSSTTTGLATAERIPASRTMAAA